MTIKTAPHGSRQGGSAARVPDSLPVLVRASQQEVQSGGATPSTPPRLCTSASEPALGRGFAARNAAFLARQQNHSSLLPRKCISDLQRELAKNGRLADDVEFWGAKGAEGFRVYLQRKFGSVVAGWRALDRDRRGKVSFYELCNACRLIGYHGNLKKLWSELDTNGSGQVSLMEIDKEVGHYVGTFKLALMRKYGDILTAWRQGLDINNTGRIEEPEVIAACQRLGLELDGRKLFGMLVSGPKGLGLTLMEFDPDAWNRFVSGDLQGLASSRPDVEFFEDLPEFQEQAADLKELQEHPAPGGVGKWRRVLADKQRSQVSEERCKVTKLKAGLHTVAGFKQALVVRCGSLLGAWREALDLDGNGRITFGEFCLALQRLAFHGDVRGLWQKLEAKSGRGHLVFADLDPETDAALTQLRAKLTEAHGNMLLAWLKDLDTKGTGCVTEQQFVQACEKNGFVGDARQLFRLMQPDASRKFLTLKDFDTRAFLALNRGDFRMLTEPEAKVSRPLEMNFDQRQQASFHFQLAKSWGAAQRDEFAKACRVANSPDRLIDSPEEFEDLCSRKFGSLIGAWRGCLDYDGNGKLTFSEFCQASRRLGYGGDIKSLWQQYDRDKKGFISLKDIDPEADRLVGSFLSLLCARFGHIDNAWRQGFNKDPHDSIDEQELAEACAALGYSEDVRKLLKCLQPMPGRLLLTIWDLDPLCNRNRQRGQSPIFSEPKSPTSHPERPKPSFGEGQVAVSSTRGSGASAARLAGRSAEGCERAQLLENLRQSLRLKYGSTVAGWRRAMDPDMQGNVAWGKFVLVLQDLSFQGNRKKLWEALTGGQEGRTSIRFEDVDLPSLRTLDAFRERLLAERSCLLEAWSDLLDIDSVGKVDEAVFTEAVAALGIPARNAKKLFRMLMAFPEQRSLTSTELQPLLIGVPPLERIVVWAGGGPAPRPPCSGGAAWAKPRPRPGGVLEDAEEEAEDGQASSPQEEPRVEVEPPLSWPSSPSSPARARPGSLATALSPTASPLAPLAAPSPSGCGPWLFAQPELSHREFAAKASKEFHEQDFVVSTLDGFKRMLVSKYGSIFSAWRKILDADRNGLMTQVDFASVCHTLGIKAVQSLWTELDAFEIGKVTLADLDPKVASSFQILEALLIEQFGSTKEGWNRTFAAGGFIRCDRQRFASQCRALGFEGDAETFFRRLRPEPGVPYLTYEDLWYNLDRNDFLRPGEEPPGSPLGAASPARRATSMAAPVSALGSPKASSPSHGAAGLRGRCFPASPVSPGSRRPDSEELLALPASSPSPEGPAEVDPQALGSLPAASLVQARPGSASTAAQELRSENEPPISIATPTTAISSAAPPSEPPTISDAAAASQPPTTTPPTAGATPSAADAATNAAGLAVPAQSAECKVPTEAVPAPSALLATALSPSAAAATG